MKALPASIFLLLLLNFSHAFCQYDSLKGGGIYASEFNIDNIPRNITYYMPVNYGKSDAYPLVIFLHDDKSSAKNTIKAYGSTIHTKADAADCVVMYPDAIGGHWNSKLNNSSDSINDVAFIGIMLEFFVQQYHCDEHRIYVMGTGNGGNMCYRVNCDKPNVLAAIATINATVAAGDLPNCRAKEAIPLSDVKSSSDAKADLGKAFDFLLTHTRPGK